MAQESFKLPDIGEGTAEAELVCWHVSVGDMVQEDQPLCDVMTDKATVEVTSPLTGKVVQRTGTPGEMVPVGSVILVFEVETAAAIDVPGNQAQTPATLLPPSAVGDAGQHEAAAPEEKKRILASPALRQRAAALGVDLAAVQGSGPSGRIRQFDLERHQAEMNKRTPAGVPTPGTSAPEPASPRPGFDDTGGVDEVPVIGLRRRIAERLQDTKRRIPHFSYIEEVDVTQLDTLRARLNEASATGRSKLTILPFLIRAVAQAIPRYPQINALYDDTAGIVRRYNALHAGVATQTPAGLVVTVVRDAQRLDPWGVATEIARLSDAARSGRALPSDLTGSTFTITSLGAMGGVATTPVINSPEVAILGVNKMIERPVVRDGRIEVAKMMNLSASFDHRVVDGWDAASFIQDVKRLLETPALLFVS